MITADSRQKSVTLELTIANKQWLLTTATTDKQLKPISAAVVPLREGPADIYYAYKMFTMHIKYVYRAYQMCIMHIKYVLCVYNIMYYACII